MDRGKQETNRSAAVCSRLSIVAAIGMGLAVLTQIQPPLGIVAVLAAFACVAMWATSRRRLRRVVTDAVQKHQPALIRRRAQLLRTDAYGAEQSARWVKEIDYFIDTQIVPSLRRRQHNAFRRRHAQFVKVIADRVAAGAAKTLAMQPLGKVKTGADFEVFCAEELRRAGWKTKLTGVTDDQGADLVAEKRGVSIVLQCKFYSRPVGKKAVQEVVAARAHEHADHAAVVSNRAYTTAADELAQTNSVLLLHHTQLAQLDTLLGINQAK